ncbi:hypothetical protein [uncultured Lamprocystis sp.]|uniref:hypothetical protein n=1 Tax=uncultured Lamprocystis sp. TaxID=543132 RepID=UPI0025EF4BDD|nr:hypothetical protein [uncultured Lamprocystis sp.]
MPTRSMIELTAPWTDHVPVHASPGRCARRSSQMRFTHPDGSAKEWGYAEMGTGSGLF